MPVQSSNSSELQYEKNQKAPEKTKGPRGSALRTAVLIGVGLAVW